MPTAYFILFAPVFLGISFLWIFENILIFFVRLVTMVIDAITSFVVSDE